MNHKLFLIYLNMCFKLLILLYLKILKASCKIVLKIEEEKEYLALWFPREKSCSIRLTGSDLFYYLLITLFTFNLYLKQVKTKLKSLC